MLLFLFYNTLLCISIPYCVRVVLFFAVRRSFFLLHSRFSTRLDEQWVDDDNDDNDVHKSSCIQTHRYCLHVSVVRPGLAWTVVKRWHMSVKPSNTNAVVSLTAIVAHTQIHSSVDVLVCMCVYVEDFGIVWHIVYMLNWVCVHWMYVKGEPNLTCGICKFDDCDVCLLHIHDTHTYAHLSY